MNKIINIAVFDFKKLFRDKVAILSMILLPLVFTFIMSSIYPNSKDIQEIPKVGVGVTNLCSSELAATLVEELRADPSVYLLELTEQEILDAVKSSGIEVGFIIPEDFGQEKEDIINYNITVVKTPSSSGHSAIVSILESSFTEIIAKEGTRGYYKNKLDSLNITEQNRILFILSKKFDEKINKGSLVTVESSVYTAGNNIKKFDGRAQSSMGIAVMFVMFIVIIGGMGTILDDKKNNTWGRLGISPTSFTQIMAGKILGTFIKGWTQIIVLILFGKFVLGVDWGNSLGTSIIVLSIYLLSVTGIGMFLATLVKTDAQLGPLATIIIIPTSMLSGCYWPIEIMSETMQKIAVLFPQYWAMKALRSTVIANMSLSDTAIPLIIMGAMGMFFFVLSTMSGAFKHEPKQKRGKGADVAA